MRGVLIAAVLGLLAASPGAAQTPAVLGADGPPETFVRSLYARYAPNEEMDGESPEYQDENVYTPAVLALMARDRRLHDGELGFIDADWICQCQDPEGVRLRDVRVTPTGPRRARAAVRFDFTTPRSERRLRLDLERTARGWRVADVVPEGDPGLVAGLRRSNAEAERAARRR